MLPRFNVAAPDLARMELLVKEAMSSKTCFNVAAPDLARMEGKIIMPTATKSASMWPRLIWRGWYIRPARNDRLRIRFNVAAPDLARMVERLELPRPVPSRFNVAAPDLARMGCKTSSRARAFPCFNVAAPDLARMASGRICSLLRPPGFNVAAPDVARMGDIASAVPRFRVPASMWPRSDRRGWSPPPAILPERFNELQCGRA